MSTTTLPRPKPSVKRPVETFRQTRERWIRTCHEAIMDPEIDEFYRNIALRRIGRHTQELSQIP